MNRKHGPTALCVLFCGLGACPYDFMPTRPAAQGASGTGSQAPLCLGIPTTCPGLVASSWTCCCSGWGLAWRTQGGPIPTICAPALTGAGPAGLSLTLPWPPPALPSHWASPPQQGHCLGEAQALKEHVQHKGTHDLQALSLPSRVAPLGLRVLIGYTDQCHLIPCRITRACNCVPPTQ